MFFSATVWAPKTVYLSPKWPEYVTAENGWMDSKQFYAQMTDFFVKKYLCSDLLFCWLMGMELTLITTLVSFLLKIKSFSSASYIPCCTTDRGFFGAFKHNFSKEPAKLTVQYPSISILTWQFPFIFTRAYELSCKTNGSSHIIISGNRYLDDYRMNIDHNLFNPSKAYQILEATDNLENNVDNFNVDSDNDVNNWLLHNTNVKATDCPPISIDNQVNIEKDPQNV